MKGFHDLLPCTQDDVCAYDHTCHNHRVLSDAIKAAVEFALGTSPPAGAIVEMPGGILSKELVRSIQEAAVLASQEHSK